MISVRHERGAIARVCMCACVRRSPCHGSGGSEAATGSNSVRGRRELGSEVRYTVALLRGTMTALLAALVLAAGSVPTTAAGSVRYDAATHVASGSLPAQTSSQARRPEM